MYWGFIYINRLFTSNPPVLFWPQYGVFIFMRIVEYFIYTCGVKKNFHAHCVYNEIYVAWKTYQTLIMNLWDFVSNILRVYLVKYQNLISLIFSYKHSYIPLSPMNIYILLVQYLKKGLVKQELPKQKAKVLASGLQKVNSKVESALQFIPNRALSLPVQRLSLSQTRHPLRKRTQAQSCSNMSRVFFPMGIDLLKSSRKLRIVPCLAARSASCFPQPRSFLCNACTLSATILSIKLSFLFLTVATIVGVEEEMTS